MDPHGLFCGETPLGLCGSGRVRVVEFSYYATVAIGIAVVRMFRSHVTEDSPQTDWYLKIRH